MSLRPSSLPGLLALGLFATPSAAVAAPPKPPSRMSPATVEGTRLIVTAKYGRKVSDQGLIGAVIVASTPEGETTEFRIDRIVPDARHKTGDVQLYTFSVRDAEGAWREYCTPDPDGISGGFPLAGTWRSDGKHVRGGFSVTCTSGAIGKCVTFGYRPWARDARGRSLWDAHQACVRMLRADYCGNGNAHTRNGVHIDIVDAYGLMAERSPELSFEAAWTPDGAACVSHVRLPNGLWTLPRGEESCPLQRKGRGGPMCRERGALGRRGVLMFNRS